MARTANQRKAWSKLSGKVRHWIRNQPLAKWAKRIKREWEYKCGICSKDKSLEAHHIYLKSLYPSKIEDCDNGMMLCTKCHDEVHTIYIKDRALYWELMNNFMSKRAPIKKCSVPRNPSDYDYKALGYKELPVELTVDGELPETIVMNNRQKKSKRTDTENTTEGKGANNKSRKKDAASNISPKEKKVKNNNQKPKRPRKSESQKDNERPKRKQKTPQQNE